MSGMGIILIFVMIHGFINVICAWLFPLNPIIVLFAWCLRLLTRLLALKNKTPQINYLMRKKQSLFVVFTSPFFPHLITQLGWVLAPNGSYIIKSEPGPPPSMWKKIWGLVIPPKLKCSGGKFVATLTLLVKIFYWRCASSPICLKEVDFSGTYSF